MYHIPSIKNHCNQLLFITTVSISLLCASSAEHETPTMEHERSVQKKPLTVLVYVAGDNSLSDYAYVNLKQATKIGSNDNLNILFYFNVKTATQPKVTKKLYITPGGYEQDGNDEVRDSGSEKTVIEACKWALMNYPSDQFVLIFWNHGSGAINRTFLSEKSVCFDDTTGNNLTDAKMVTALKYVVNVLRKGKKIDVIAFDACLEAGIEIFDTLTPYSNYVVASEQTIPEEGYHYSLIFQEVAKRPVTSEQYAKYLVLAYNTAYLHSNEDYTLSAITTQTIPFLSANIGNVARLLDYLLYSEDKEATATLIKKSSTSNAITRFDEPTYVDLYEWYENMIHNIPPMVFTKKGAAERLLDMLKTGLSLIKKTVIANTRSSSLKNAQGISIYLPEPGVTIDPGYTNTIWAQKNDWSLMIRHYLQIVNK